MTPREKFRLAYRVGRLLPHHRACAAALKKLDGVDEAIVQAGLSCASRYRCGEWLFGVQASRVAGGNGRSRSKCIEISLRAVKTRAERRHYRWDPRQPYFPATKFHRWVAA